MGSKTARAERQRQREDNTAQLMENIMTGGEISKAREAELQKAANYGRGVQFIPGSPTVKGVMQIDPATGEKKPVYRTGTTAADFTGKIIANAPTFGEALGDAGIALFGGQAERPIFTSPDAPPGRETGMDFANMVPAPERTQGIIPALVNTGGIGGMALNIIRDLFPKQEEEEEDDTSGNVGFALEPLLRTKQNLENTRSSDLVAFLRGDTSVDPDVKVGSFEPDTPFISVRNPNTGETEIMMDPDPGLARSVLGNQTIQDLISLNQFPSRTFQGETTTNFPMAEGRTGLSAEEKARQDLEAAGYSDDQINAIIDRTFFKQGGSVPPEKGPMSQGVGSLFQER